MMQPSLQNKLIYTTTAVDGDSACNCTLSNLSINPRGGDCKCKHFCLSRMDRWWFIPSNQHAWRQRNLSRQLYNNSGSRWRNGGRRGRRIRSMQYWCLRCLPYDDIVDGALRVGAIIVGLGEVGVFLVKAGDGACTRTRRWNCRGARGGRCEPSLIPSGENMYSRIGTWCAKVPFDHHRLECVGSCGS